MFRSLSLYPSLSRSLSLFCHVTISSLFLPCHLLLSQFPTLVVSKMVVCNFARKRSFALFCTLLHSFALFRGCAFVHFCTHLCSFGLICVFLHPIAFRTNASGNCRLLISSCLTDSFVSLPFASPFSSRDFSNFKFRDSFQTFGTQGSGDFFETFCCRDSLSQAEWKPNLTLRLRISNPRWSRGGYYTMPP